MRRFRAEDLTAEQQQMLDELRALAAEQEKAAAVAKEMTVELERSGMSWVDIVSAVGVALLALLALT